MLKGQKFHIEINFGNLIFPCQVAHGWRSKLYIIPIVLFSILYNIPKFFELRVRESNSTASITNEERNLLLDTESETILMIKKSEYYIERTALLIHNYYVNIYVIYTNIIVNGEFHCE